MNIDMNVDASNVTAPPVNSDVSLSTDSVSSNGKDVYSYALSTLQDIYNFLASLSTSLYSNIRRDTTLARDDQAESNDVDALIAKVSEETDPKTTIELTQQVIDFMTKNGIDIGGKSITQYMTDCDKKDGRKPDSHELNKGELAAVKNALDNAANRATDISSQNQIKIQNILQALNNTINNMSSYIKQRGDMISTIIRNLN